MGVVGAAAMSATCLHGGVRAATMTPLALGGDGSGNGSIGQGFINGGERRLTTAWNGFADAGALNQTELRAAKRG